MNQDQDNITTMFETTNVVLDANNSIWSGMPAFADAVTRVKGGTAAIRQKQGQQASTGDADAKQLVRDTVEERTLLIGAQLSALASKTNDPVLAAKVAFDKSTLDKMAVSDLLTAAKSVQTAANANSGVLASDYLVTAADLAQLDAAIVDLDAVKDDPRTAIVDKRVATMSLPAAIAFVRGIYRNELDKMILRFKSSDPDFYNAYFAARVIVDRPGTRSKKTTPTPPPSSTP